MRFIRSLRHGRAGGGARALALACVLAVVTLASCGDDEGTRPVPAFEGQWQLALVDGSPPPRVLSGSGGGDYILVDAIIEFRSRGRLTDRRTFETRSSSGTPGEPRDEEWVVSYLRRGDSLFVMRDPVGPNPAQVDTGIVADGALELRIQSISQFVRVPLTLTYTLAAP